MILFSRETSLFSHCCYVKKERVDVNCIAPDDSISDCDRMIKNNLLRYIVWIVLLLTIGGNAFALILRITYLDSFHIQNILILSLNFGDLFMGLYIAAIVNRDLDWSGDYYLHDHQWRSSAACKGFGALALMSSEVCVLTLAVITYDRRKIILYGFENTPIKRGTYNLIIAFIWLFSIVIAVVPAVVKNYFYNENKAEGYYGTNGLCLPLQLPGEKDTAWEYCLALFGVLNFVVACFMAWAYCTIFYASYIFARDSENVQSMKEESEMSIRFVAIVFTDILCWFPIATLIYLSLAGFVNDTDNTIYAWFSICVATFNSALNPIIYTITSPFFWTKIKEWFKCNRGSCCTPSKHLKYVLFYIGEYRTLLVCLCERESGHYFKLTFNIWAGKN